MGIVKEVVKKNRNLVFEGVVELLIFFFLALNFIFHDISIGAVIKVFLYQFLAWYLTGKAIVILLKISVKKFAELMALSYLFGGVSAVIFYLVFMMLGIGLMLPFFTIIESAVVLFYLYKKKAYEEYDEDIFDEIILILFLFVYFFLTFFAVSLVNSFPNETGGTGFYVDWPFWAGNNIEMTRKFPIDNFRQVGVGFKYHYFSSMLMAQMSMCMGVDINWISFYFSSVFSGTMLVLSGYYFSTRVLTKRWLIVLSMIAALFTDGSTVTFTWHTSICPFGFDYGYAYGMMSLAFLAEILKNKKLKELLIPSCFLIAMTTGCKGPIGIVILASFGMAALLYLFNRQIKKGLVCGIAWLLSFVGVYFIFIHSSLSVGTTAGVQYIGGLDVDTIVENAPWVQIIYNSIISSYRIEGNHLLIKLYSIWLYVYRANYVVITLSIISLFAIVSGFVKKKYDGLLYSLSATVLAGILFAIYTTQNGGSQMYFMMGMFPAAIMGGTYALDELQNHKDELRWGQIIYKAASIVLVFMMGISTNIYYETVMQKVREGVAVVRDTYTSDDYTRYYVDENDYSTFMWLKANTDKNDFIAVDSHVDEYERDISMVMGVFSQRYIWNETKYIYNEDEAIRRDAIVANIAVDAEECVNQMKDEGVDYFVYRLFPDKTEGITCDSLLELFRNSNYIVYKIN